MVIDVTSVAPVASEPVQVIPKTLFQHIEDILGEMHVVLVERGANYADIKDNSTPFKGVMESLGIQVPEGMTDVEFHCMSNIATKLARFASGNRQHEDNFVDIANYTVLMLADLRRRKEHASLQP